MTDKEYKIFWKQNRVHIPFQDKEMWLIKKIIDCHNKIELHEKKCKKENMG